MISWAITFFIIALIAIALGFGGVGALALQLGYVIGAIGLVLLVISLLTGRRTAV